MAILISIRLARIGVIVLQIIVNVTARYVVATLLRQNVFEHVLSRPGAVALPGTPGDAISRLRHDADDIGHFVGAVFSTVGNASRQRAAIRDTIFNALLGTSFGGLRSLGMGMTLLLAAQALRTGHFTIGDLALFNQYLGLVTELPRSIGNLVARYRQIGVAFR